LFRATRLDAETCSTTCRNQHTYTAEKTDALKRLARLIEKIVSGEGENVVPLRAPAVQP
jgi:hypothetical protein